MLGSPPQPPRSSAKGQPGPLDVPGRVLVPVEHAAAGGTAVCAGGQALGHPLAAAAALLVGGLRGDGQWDLELALVHANESLALARESGNQRTIASSLLLRAGLSSL